MHIIIKEENGFMPDTIISIYENRVEYEENKVNKILNYNVNQIKEIIRMFIEICQGWKDKYIDKSIIDDDIFCITVVGHRTRQFYIKNKYPENWDKFILFRNKLIREELKF